MKLKMKTSLKNKIKFFILERVLPCWRMSGRKMTYFSDDYHEVHIEIPFKRINRGPHGFIYGGSLFSAVDAIPAFQYFLILGPNYIVWDKEATISFKLPCKDTLYVKNKISPGEIEEIKSKLDHEQKFERTYMIELIDAEGAVHVVVEKILHFRLNTHKGGDKNDQTRNPLL